MFYKEIDKRYREMMEKYLKKHFRYNYVELRIMPSKELRLMKTHLICGFAYNSHFWYSA